MARGRVYFRVRGKTKRKIWYIDFEDESGKRVRRATDAATKLQAQEILRVHLDQVHRRKYLGEVEYGGMTLNQWAVKYLARKEIQGKKGMRFIRQSLNPVLEFIGAKDMREITVQDAENYKAHRLASKTRHNRPYSPSTVNRELAVLRNVFSEAQRFRLDSGEYLVTDNPVRLVRMEKEPDPRKPELSDDDFELLLSECEDYLKPIVILAYATGMRKSEILGLTRSQVDLKAGEIRLPHGSTKSGHGRIVPLYMFEESHGLVGALRAVMPALHTDRFFTRPATKVERDRGERRQWLPVKDIKSAFNRAVEKAGLIVRDDRGETLDRFRFHDLRHVAVTRMRRAGIHHTVIMAITGHRTLAMHDRYNTVGREDFRNATELLRSPSIAKRKRRE